MDEPQDDLQAPEEEIKGPDKVEELLQHLNDEPYELVLAEHPFRIKGKDGKVVNYKLMELTATERSNHMSFRSMKAKLDPKTGQVQGLKDMKGVEINLLAQSVKMDDTKGGWVSVPEAVIAAWPGRLVADLSAVAMRISGLDEKAEKHAKNS